MSQNSSSNEQGVPVNATTILAILTLLGGILVAGHKLASDRPVVSPGNSNSDISEQKVDTRLWEDPFTQASRLSATNELVGNLAGTLTEERNTNFHVIAVMVPGGPASESRERRIRSRFAVVSALAESAYSPTHPAQIGIASMPWPSTLKLLEAFSRENAGKAQAYFHEHTNYMLFGFEWYEAEHFAHHPWQSSADSSTAPVLLLWLDEDQFADRPIARLNLFYNSLSPNDWWGQNTSITNPVHRMSLIGPGSSGTLKAMLKEQLDAGTNTSLLTGNLLTNLIQHVSLFLPAPRAIDEVLVDDPGDKQREAVLRHLNNTFKTNTTVNFAATDSDLAHEVLDELRHRGVDLAKTDNNLVLIGGWDEYFGRMLSAAYAAELSITQRGGFSRATFLADYRSGKMPGPTNLHTFFYLSGLDGQALSTQARNSAQQPDSSPLKDDSKGIQNARWTPDVNRAEGPAQYDYLGRLACRIENLEDELIRDGRGTISAIGISGGDVYDTLLVLQALRRRFPQTIFFTTDLDARFWDPKEWPWSRNLVVVSGYGLSLNEKYQHQTAPFRDSNQTALFAAALAALGDTNLLSFKGGFPVRRFEIGRYGPVDLSADNDLNAANPGRSALHPHVKPWAGFVRWLPEGYHLLATCGLLAGAFVLALVFWRGFRMFTIARNQFRARPLWLREEDIGGLEGFVELAWRLGHPKTASGGNGAGAREDEEKDELQKQKEWLKKQRDQLKEEKDPVKEEEEWLKKEIGSKICEVENQLDEALEDRGATSIFEATDILKPKEFVGLLKAHASGGQAAVLQQELSANAQVALDDWEQQPGHRGDSLQTLVSEAREILNSVDFSKTSRTARSEHKATTAQSEHKVLWRRNRQLFASEDFKTVIRPPICLADLLMGESPEAQRDWRRELREALRDPERRDSLRVAMLQVLDSWNARLIHKGEPGITSPSIASNGSARVKQPRQEIATVRSDKDLDRLKQNRDAADKMILTLLSDVKHSQNGASPDGANAETNRIANAAKTARDVTQDLFTLCSLRIGSLGLTIGGAILLALFMLYSNLHDTPYPLWDFSGASLWPSNWLALLGLVLGFLFLTESYFQLRQTVFMTTRQCRLAYSPPTQANTQNPSSEWRSRRRLWSAVTQMFYPSSSEPIAVVNADEAWQKYQHQGCGTYRFCRTLVYFLAYEALLLSAYQLIFGHQYSPSLRAPAGTWYQALVWPAFLLFVFLSFWTIDAACLCRWFIQRISQGPTEYSFATRQHFSKQRGQVPYHVLSEWIDVSIIAQITERVGRLIYFPAILLLLLLLSNDGLLYYFPWPPSYYVLVTCNFAVAAASIIILQSAARKARNQSVEALEEKLNQLRGGAATTEAQKKQHDINETEDMLNQIRSLRKGAFGGFWTNPVVGALLIPSGGTALIEIVRYLIK